MKATAPSPYDRAARQIEGMVKQGTPFTRVEDVISEAEAPEDDKAALWLLAWSLQKPSPLQVRGTPLVGWVG